MSHASGPHAQHEPAKPTGSGFALAGIEEVRDLRTLISRVRSVDPDAAVRLQGAGPALAVWVPVLSPAGLLDPGPLVLGLRVVALAHASTEDLTVPAAAVLDRLARLDGAADTPDPAASAADATATRSPDPGEPSAEGEPAASSAWLGAPPQEVTAGWAGILPPRSGWTVRAAVPAQRVREVAAQGVAAVAAAVPADAGAPVLARVRARIWGGSSGWVPGDVAPVPDGAAFGLDVLGFLPAAVTEVTVATEATGQWVRLSTATGHVLVKSGGLNRAG